MALWYYGENGQQVGPVDESAIRAHIASGRLTQQSMVWREGMVHWLPVAQVAELSQPHQPVIYSTPAHLPPLAQTSGLATASLVCGILGFVVCPLTGIPAVVCGHMALNQINRSPVQVLGRGMAIAGLILGYVQALVCLIFLGILLIFGIAAFSNF